MYVVGGEEFFLEIWFIVIGFVMELISEEDFGRNEVFVSVVIFMCGGIMY